MARSKKKVSGFEARVLSSNSSAQLETRNQKLETALFSPTDHAFMSRALELAQRGLYTTTPNPRVGCIIVKENVIVGEGWHAYAGGPHAEIIALSAAGARARGATVYLTLEPCNHYGRTPPCTEALIRAKIARLVAAMPDPNPKMMGNSFKKLTEAGIHVAYGLMEQSAQELNMGFVSRMKRGRPWIRLKIAASLDGKIALNNGSSQWITSEASRRDSHHWRARSCAVLTGIGTIISDNPRLTVREVSTSHQPLRIILDSLLRCPINAKVLQGDPTLICTIQDDSDQIKRFKKKGINIVTFPHKNKKIDLTALMQELNARELNEILVEAGPKLNGALLKEAWIDECIIYFAPCFIGDKAQSLFNLPELKDLNDKYKGEIYDVQKIGKDVRIIFRLSK